MKVVKFDKDVYWAWDEGAKYYVYTHDSHCVLQGLHVVHAAGSEHSCSEEYYADLARNGVEMAIVMDIPDEKFKRFCKRYQEKLVAKFSRPEEIARTDDSTAMIRQAADEIDAEWKAEGRTG